MDGYGVYREYCAIKSHFNGSYDYFKYGGTKTKRATYEKRKDIAFFERLAKKNLSYIVPFMVANFVNRPTTWVGDLVINKEAEDVYFAWKKKLSRTFIEADIELKNIKDFLKARNISFNDMFVVEKNEQPILFRLLTQRYISIESYIIIDVALNFKPTFDKRLKDDIIYNQWKVKIDAYKPFLSLDETKCVECVKSAFLCGDK